MNIPEEYRVTQMIAEKYSRIGNLFQFVSDSSYGEEGAFLLPQKGRPKGAFFFCLLGTGEGWEHVSVSIPSEKRCPTWEEMAYIKSMFWDKHETVVEFHPPESEYVNNSPFVLHLWKPKEVEIPLPPSILVGIKGVQFK